jgi:carotenoid cleavage dioxygenase-like enzyme
VTVMTGGFANISRTMVPQAGTQFTQWNDDLAPMDQLCMMAAFAHGIVDPDTGHYISVTGCVNMVPVPLLPEHHIIFSIDPSTPTKRKVLAKLPLKGRSPSYMHSFAHTKKYIVLIAAPVFMETKEVMMNKGMSEGALRWEDKEDTLFQVVDRITGKLVREFSAPAGISSHLVNSYEDHLTGDIVIDVTYKTMQSKWFFEQFEVDNLISKPRRDLWARGSVMRYKLHQNGTVSRSYTLPKEPDCNIEVPKVHPAKVAKPYCVFWGVQYGSNSSEGFSSFAVIKRNICTGESLTSQQHGHFPAEHEFVPKYADPKEGQEDEGVLIGIMLDGAADTSYVQILDAKTLKRIASAPLGLKVPFPVHTSYFPAQETNEMVV